MFGLAGGLTTAVLERNLGGAGAEFDLSFPGTRRARWPCDLVLPVPTVMAHEFDVLLPTLDHRPFAIVAMVLPDLPRWL